MGGKLLARSATLGLCLGLLGWGSAGPPPLAAQEEAGQDTARDAAAAADTAGGAAAGADTARGDTTAVLAAARAFLEGITTGDTALLRSVTSPDLRLEGTTAEGAPPPRPAGLSRGEFLTMIAGPGAAYVERMWDPAVRIRGRIADVWAPYDLYRDGEFSHCGQDAFHLVETADGWKVVSVVWTVEQPPACERHPRGPPPAPETTDRGPAG